MARRPPPVLVWVLLGLRPVTASADGPGELTLGIEVDRCTPPQGDPALAPAVAAAIGVDDAWAVLASAFDAEHALDPPQQDAPQTLHVTGLALGAEYSLDVLDVRPYLDVLVGALVERE